MKNDYYVYVYSDPDSGRPFYVGKGRGGRVNAHLKFKKAKTEKQKLIERYIGQGRKPAMQIVQWGMSESEAFAAEAAMIQFLGLDQIANRICGRGKYKVHADFLEYIKSKKPLCSRRRGGKPVLVLSANQVYRPGMSRFELYDAVRGNLQVCPGRLDECKMVFVLVDGFVIDVYQNVGYVDAGTEARMFESEKESTGYDIVAKFCSEVMKHRYVGRELLGVSFGFSHFAYVNV